MLKCITQIKSMKPAHFVYCCRCPIAWGSGPKSLRSCSCFSHISANLSAIVLAVTARLESAKSTCVGCG